MSTDLDSAKEAAHAIAAKWDITLQSDLAPEAALAHVRQVLAQKIATLLLSDFPRLANAFYRLDVNESKVKAVLNDKSAPPEDIPLKLADLVIEREQQKARSRKAYGG